MIFYPLFISSQCFESSVCIVGCPDVQRSRSHSLTFIKISIRTISFVILSPVINPCFSDERESFNRSVPFQLTGSTDISIDVLHERFPCQPCFRAVIVLIPKTAVRLLACIDRTLAYGISYHPINTLRLSIGSIVFIVIGVNIQIEGKSFSYFTFHSE